MGFQTDLSWVLIDPQLETAPILDYFRMDKSDGYLYVPNILSLRRNSFVAKCNFMRSTIKNYFEINEITGTLG